MYIKIRDHARSMQSASLSSIHAVNVKSDSNTSWNRRKIFRSVCIASFSRKIVRVVGYLKKTPLTLGNPARPDVPLDRSFGSLLLRKKKVSEKEYNGTA